MAEDWEYTRIGVLRSHLQELETAISNKQRSAVKIHGVIARGLAERARILALLAEEEKKGK